MSTAPVLILPKQHSATELTIKSKSTDTFSVLVVAQFIAPLTFTVMR